MYHSNLIIKAFYDKIDMLLLYKKYEWKVIRFGNGYNRKDP